MTEQASPTVNLVQYLIDRNLSAEQNFFDAAEQVDNRGLKLLLKAYAQQHAEFARQLAQTLPTADDHSVSSHVQAEEAAVDAPGFLRRGLLNLKAAMIVRREQRQRAAISDLLQEETPTINAYTQSINKSAADQQLTDLIEEQYVTIRETHNQLKLLVEKKNALRLVLRLFDKTESTHDAVGRLAAVTAADDVITVPIREVPVYYNDRQARPRSIRETVITGGLLGVVAGGLLGAIYGIFHAIATPNLNGFLATTPAGVIGELALYWALFGLLFAMIFSALIARSTQETDRYLYNESLRQGKTLVAVFTDEQHRPNVERALGLQHEHEIEPIPA